MADAAKWSDPARAARYAQGRFRSARRRERDPRLVSRALARHLDGRRVARLLDVPAGTGRLRPALEAFTRFYVAADLSPAMLVQGSLGREQDGRRLVADAMRLPFADGAVPVVVSCRLLHHQHDPGRFRALVAELVRVADELVVASFWDAGALPERRRLRPRRDARVAHPKDLVAEAFAAAGATVLSYHHSMRFLSRQTFVAARKDRPRGAS